MPLTSFVFDALGVVTLCLVAVLVLLGLFCILYSIYFRSRIHSQGLLQLCYFSGPWVIRIALVFFAIWWGFGEIIRLNLLRCEGRILSALSLKWQENICKCYIVSNLGFAEPCLFLTLVFLLRASLQKTEYGTLSRKWNCKTAGYVLLFCLPVFVLQLTVIMIGPQFNEVKHHMQKLPHYFLSTATTTMTKDHDDVALCTYPLFSIIFLGLFATVLTSYLFWLGRQILHLVINKGLQKRVYILILSTSAFFLFRVLLLGLSVLSMPEHFPFEALAFLAFLSLLCFAVMCICMLVFYPIADSLALRNMQDIEARTSDEHNDTISLIANQSLHEESMENSPGRNSTASAKRGSISFCTMGKDEPSEAFLELSLFSHSQHSSPPGSPRLLGWAMHSPTPFGS